MKKVIALTCMAVLAVSLFNILSVDDTLVHLIVLGTIPGTTIDLNEYAILGLSLLTLPMIVSWIMTFNDQLIASKLATIQSESVAAYEQQVAEKKLETTQTIAQQLEIDELDAITL